MMNGVSVRTVLISLAIVLAGAVGGYLLHAIVRWLGRKADQSRFQIDGILLRIVGPPLGVLVALVSVDYALYRIPEIRAQFGQWEGAQRVVLILTGTWILASLVKNLIRAYGLPLAERTDTDVDERLVRVLDLTALYVIWIGGLLIALRELGIEVTAFIASMGIAGLAVTLQILVWLDGPRGKRRVRDRIFREALGRFAEAGIEIPFPQRVVRLESRDPSGPDE